MDWTGKTRSTMLWEFDMSERTKTQIKNNIQLQTYPEGYEHIYEYDSLGIYLTRHPMEGKGDDFNAVRDEETCTLYGIIFEIAVNKQKNGKDMAFVTLNTANGNVKVLVFANMYERPVTKSQIFKGNYVLIRGRKSKSSLMLDSIGGIR
jgi:DNA polymerase III alpha subunit